MWKHSYKISKGQRGTISKIREEFQELEDADNQDISQIWTVIEASDLIREVGALCWRKHNVPLWLIIGLIYLRIPFKVVRNLVFRFS